MRKKDFIFLIAVSVAHVFALCPIPAMAQGGLPELQKCTVEW